MTTFKDCSQKVRLSEFEQQLSDLQLRADLLAIPVEDGLLGQCAVEYLKSSSQAPKILTTESDNCLLYTSDAADEL